MATETTSNNNTAEVKANQKQDKAIDAMYADVKLDDNQLVVLNELGLMDDRHNLAISAFASVLRGKLQSSIDKAIKAKYEADSREKKAVSEELEKEIQRGIALKRTI